VNVEIRVWLHHFFQFDLNLGHVGSRNTFRASNSRVCGYIQGTLDVKRLPEVFVNNRKVLPRGRVRSRLVSVELMSRSRDRLLEAQEGLIGVIQGRFFGLFARFDLYLFFR